MTTGLVGVTCRGSELSLNINAGVGYQMPATVATAINLLLNWLHVAPVSNVGGLTFTSQDPLWHNASDNPKGCAGYK